MTGQTLADRCASLALIEARWSHCGRCTLIHDRKNVVNWRGNPSARLVIVGEAPGADEDARGEPFVGPAGRYLDAMLADAGVSKDDVFVCNRVGCRPPGNRQPEPEEVGACRPRLEDMLEVVRPARILLMGLTAAGLAGVQNVSAFVGTWVRVDITGLSSVRAMVTWHPSHVMRSDASTRRAFVKHARAAYLEAVSV